MSGSLKNSDLQAEIKVVQFAFTAAWAALIFAIALIAAMRGDWPERAGAYSAMAAWLASLLVTHPTPTVSGPYFGLFAVDMVMLIVLFAIGLRSDRIWPLIACGFQLCGIGIHIAYWLQPALWSGAYFVGLQIPSSAVLIAISAGVLRKWLVKPKSICESNYSDRSDSG